MRQKWKDLLTYQIEESAYKNKVASAIELLDGEMQHEKITQELVDATIDTVYVYDKKTDRGCV